MLISQPHIAVDDYQSEGAVEAEDLKGPGLNVNKCRTAVLAGASYSPLLNRIHFLTVLKLCNPNSVFASPFLFELHALFEWLWHFG